VFYYAAVTVRLRRFRRGRLSVIVPRLPAICIGNIQAGGTGKTPLVAWALDSLHRAGMTPGLVARGVGRTTKGLIVRQAGDAGTPDPLVLGDEVAMLLQERPWLATAVAERRADAVQALAELPHPPQLAIMDDGFSHLALARDLDVLCVDCSSPPWTMLPAGRLREPLRSLGRAECFVLNRGDETYLDAWLAALDRFAPHKPRFGVKMEPTALVDLFSGDSVPVADFAGKKVLAVSGIAHPRKFERSLLGLGMEPIPRSFGDHHRYVAAEMAEINRLVELHHCTAIITTAKDAVKWLAFNPTFPVPTYILRIVPCFDPATDEAAHLSLLTRAYEEGCKRLASAL
jgi:tetraacyldisaccharide 4'-kinase